MFHLIIPLLIFFLPQVPGAISEWHILAETEYVIEETCNTISECRVIDGVMRCWTVGAEELQVSEWPVVIPSKSDVDDKVCSELKNRKI